METTFLLLIIVLTLLPKSFVGAHPGRTASDGCHYCRTNCDRWGQVWNARHCHGVHSPPAPSYIPPPSFNHNNLSESEPKDKPVTPIPPIIEEDAPPRTNTPQVQQFPSTQASVDPGDSGGAWWAVWVATGAGWFWLRKRKQRLP